jgi:hypothetical protein
MLKPAISVASWGANRLDIFALGTDNAMYHKAYRFVLSAEATNWFPSPTTWEPLGGTFISAPAVTAWGSNRLDIFALGTDQALYHKAWDGDWAPSQMDWEPRGGALNCQPAVASWGTNRLDILGLGTDNSMYRMAWDGRSWGSWEALSGTFNPAPRPNSMPTELDWSVDSITFNHGQPVGGTSRLTFRQDGTYTFTGAFHDSGITEYNVNLVWAVKDAINRVYTIPHSGHVSGTFESGSRDDKWTVDSRDDNIAENWTYLAIEANAVIQKSADLDLVNVTNAAVGSLGLVLAIIAIPLGGGGKQQDPTNPSAPPQ